MDNHPIPQDVTGFQFKLIGNMTVKQFAYLASGSILAVGVFYTPVFFLVKLILVPLLAGLGAGLAFLPIEGRPMDLMIGNFIKDIFAPTQYIYQKQGGMLALSMVDLKPITPDVKKESTKHVSKTNLDREVKLNEFLSHVTHKSKTALDEREDIFLNAIFNPNGAPQLISLSLDKTNDGHQLSEEEAMRVKLAQSPDEMDSQLEKEAQAIKNELALAMQEEKQLETAHKDTKVAQEHVDSLEKHLQDILLQKQQLEQELVKLQQQAKAPVQKVQTMPDQPLQQSQNVRIVPSDRTTSVGLPAVPDVPNIILGIIRDSRGNILPNILVEIKDKEGNPVRAFKTNGLGQFASATPLRNGDYLIDFEDPKGNHTFETVAIEVKGEIMLPLEIISSDAREQLRKELFS